jgi:hypothetical protein
MPYPNKIRWQTDLTNYTLDNVHLVFGNKTGKKILDSLNVLQKSQYYFLWQDYNHKYLNQFYPIYEKNIRTKTNPELSDIKSRLEKYLDKSTPVKTLSLYKNNDFLGGSIVLIHDQMVNNGWSCLPHTIDLKLKASVGYLRIYLQFLETLKYDKILFSGGVTKNFAGLNGAIGLSMFKLSCGGRPSAAETDLNFDESFSWNGKDDVLAFEGSQKGQKITKAKLFLVNYDPAEIKSKYGTLFAQQDFEVQIITNK